MKSPPDTDSRVPSLTRLLLPHKTTMNCPGHSACTPLLQQRDTEKLPHWTNANSKDRTSSKEIKTSSKYLAPSRITALLWRRGLENSMTLCAKLCRATQGRWVTVESSDKTWSTGGGDGKPLQYTCHEDPMNWMKRQREMNPPGQKISNMPLGKSRGRLLTAPERMRRLGQSGKNAQLWMCLVMKVKSHTIKNSTA